MKKNICLLSTLLSIFVTKEAVAVCRNCQSEVLIKAEKAQEFTRHLLLLSSMPLEGLVIKNSYRRGYVVVRVETYEEYAKAHNIDSFDVARKITSSFAARDSSWQIKEIKAVMEFKPLNTSNAGTIGH